MPTPASNFAVQAWAARDNVISGNVSDAEDGAAALARQLDIELVEDLAGLTPSPEFLAQIPIHFAREHGLLGLVEEQSDALLHVALHDLKSWPQLDVVGRLLDRPVLPMAVPEAVLLKAIDQAYGQRSGQTQTFIDTLDGVDRDALMAQLQRTAGREDLLDVDHRAPVIKLVNLLLFEAVQGRASDAHIQPYEDRLIVRYRIDGVLFDAFEIPKPLQEEVISRVKVLGKMNIAEKRLPQDGRATAQIGDRLIDLRIASLPGSHGERVVIRLLDKSARLYRLGEIGMNESVLASFRELIHLEHGLILVTGPTGSGKSTTLYAALQEINTKNRNVITLEDPIEYLLDGISQTQINEKKGLTFARGLRNVLRQDPDIIMVGEIRDHETAVMAIQSALTGHLVFSTLHTNDAASAVTRLLDLGIEPYLVASSLIGVLAQRLVRQVCPACGQRRRATEDDLARLGMTDRAGEGLQIAAGGGCQACRGTGFCGRIGIFELLAVDESIRGLVQQRANASQLRAAATAHDMRLLHEDAAAKLFAGRTGIDEVLRVTMRTS